ncbi:TonB-dependent receptor [Salinimonas sp. HHU 13199]|uniref:TonB-dependent receptor n=1 Tax=Salinimonas profundi TaxID=2729140 RepID=A0ABR8LPP4_9ALTE|nr:TonB-dependent receptor [Salinimonas profundi]MBD3587338.1 TonB-dependent receptor [Salinimonas profundi]
MTFRRALLSASVCAVLSMPTVAQQTASDPSQNNNIERIEVQGSQVTLNGEYPGGQVARGGRAGILGNLDFMDSPFMATNFTDEIVRNQQSKSIADVLQNDPVVRVARGFGNFQEVYIIRGFPVYSDDMTYNGLYGILPRQYVAAELLERVEVFRGASTFLNGAAPGGSGLGGLVNVVPKRAPETALNRIRVGVEGQGHTYIAADVGRRYGDENENTGIRVNLVKRDGETAVDEQDREVSVASFGVDYQSDALRLSADLGFQEHDVDAPRPSVTPFGAIPSAPEADNNFAQPWTFTSEEQLFGAVRAEYDVLENTSTWLAMGFRSGEEENVLANPTASADGDFSAYRFDNTREDNVRSYEAGIRSRFSIAGVAHNLIVSASSFSMDSKNAYAFSDFSGFVGNLYNPVPAMQPSADFFTGGNLSQPLVTLTNENESVALADMMSFFNDSVMVTLGARFQAIETSSFDYNTGEVLSRYDESRVTPVAGVVYKPRETISLYANYSEGLVPGEVAPSQSGGQPVNNAGEVLDPFRSQQFEAGVKVDVGKIGGVISVYSTEKPSAIVNENIFSSDGEQRNRGVEISVFGLPHPDVKLLGGLTLVQAEQTNTQDGLNEGKDVVGIPDFQANINVEWDVAAAPGLTLDTRGIYTSEQYADAANIYEVDSSHRVDIGARYSMMLGNTDLTLQARLENVFDNNYWASVGGFPGANYLVLSEPRTAKLTASFAF